jgi:hypothetical protein
MNLQEFLKSKNGSSCETYFKGYVSMSQTGEARITLVFDNANVDIDVEDNQCIVSQIYQD